jgi:hypothetical protein
MLLALRHVQSILQSTLYLSQITAAARSKAWNVFPRSNTGIVGLNPTQHIRLRNWSETSVSWKQYDPIGRKRRRRKYLPRPSLLKKNHTPFFVNFNNGYSYCTSNITRLFSSLGIFNNSSGLANLIKIIIWKYYLVILFVLIPRSLVRLSPLGMSPVNSLLYQPGMIDEYGVFGGMRIGRGNRNTLRKPAPVPLCPP